MAEAATKKKTRRSKKAAKKKVRQEVLPDIVVAEELVPAASLVPDDRNLRRHGARNREVVKGSLGQFGQVLPVIVQHSTGRIIGGNCTTEELQKLGESLVKVWRVDVDDGEADELAVILNRAGELSEWDEEALAGRLGELVEVGDLTLEGLGFSEAELERLIEGELGARGGVLGWPVEEVSISDLKPHPQNYREHPEDQVDQLVESIEQHGFYRNVVVARDLTILAGHGVVQACTKMGRKTIPVVRLDVDPDSVAAKKVLAGDNYLSSFDDDDPALLVELLKVIREEEGDLEGTGFDDRMLAELVQGLDPEPSNADNYSRKIKTPIYEPKGDRPSESALYDRRRTKELLAEIEEADLPKDVRRFLRFAAERHTVFRFDRIAEYYAHADADVQELMERSALVIIDFDQAIERGFVRVTKAMLDQAGDVEKEKGDE